MSTELTTERKPDSQGMIQVASSRQAQEVQAAMIVAQQCPRDQVAAEQRILTACKRKRLAESAIYAYPRGGAKITGPSIRLAECMAQCWGNLDFGIHELEQRPASRGERGKSVVMAYCHDLESNVRQTKTFTVAHERHTRSGTTALSDPRDIYETVANNGARRMRACILGVIPGDIVDAAVEEVNKTLAGDNSEPLIDRIKACVVAFAELGVTKEMIEGRLGHPVENCIETDFVNLRQIYTSVRDGMTKREAWFEVPEAKKGKGVSRSKLNDKE